MTGVNRGGGRQTGGRLDPDRLAALAEERDFLLRSLDDLDEEYAAGDIDDDDYARLREDYTRRAAAVLRALENHEAAVALARAPRSPWRTMGWVAVVLILAATAGFLVARSSGARSSGETITGDIRTTTRDRLFAAQQAFGRGDVDEAIAIYEDILAEEPSNVEALAYEGWIRSRSGDLDGAWPLLEDAIAIDPAYPDARVFAAIVALDRGDPDTAAEQLAAFEALDPTPFARQLVANARVAERIAAARVEPVLLADPPGSLAEAGLTPDDVVAAAEALAVDGRFVDGVTLFERALEQMPDEPVLHDGLGWYLARAGAIPEQRSEELLTAGAERIDEALALDPTSASALVHAAFTRAELGDLEGARAALAAFDALPERPDDLVALVEQFGLRDRLADG
ncbi:MAG: hypothetical protein D6683_17580 [Actinomyces sp.]|nr:MAG: hypothetical protein D6683_17580 [Actinomyces sp.]